MNTALKTSEVDANFDADTGEHVVVGKLLDTCPKATLSNCRRELALDYESFATTCADRDFRAITPGSAMHFEKLGLMLCATSKEQARKGNLFSRVEQIHAGARLRRLPQPPFKEADADNDNDDAVGTARSPADPQWGLREIGALDSEFTGKGVRVCVIDTGFNIFHDDLKKVDAAHRRSFVGDSTVMSAHAGHGTRSAGIVGGPLRPAHGLRYGVAPDAELFVAKVLGKNGITIEALITALGWAVENQCAVVSMSIGDELPMTVFSSGAMELAASSALAAGTLVVAGAGNDSMRDKVIQPIDHPANCKSIMAVAAIEQTMKIAHYSNAGPPGGGEPKVDITGPGSSRSASFPTRYKVESGTSIATPFVAGVAALFAEAFPDVRGQELWDLLCSKARELPGHNARDFGAGLVRAPRKSDTSLLRAV
ncbi:MAG TPA: S8 family serine peptidase [Steroidobacteraceae bacterium]|nr:S8 family serine peptidase [Steroidobacteraceae bacterium]